ncbi:MAG: nitroreductase family deazaflavin-dependent oxidoreductase [Candidatus Heimdallarchaeota archaeon]|nr:nitroreductase family deazaflavin-dependent oxidoreductase [Candidatus Heimdallarchaeota archaeon]
MSHEFPRKGSMMYTIMREKGDKKSKAVQQFKFWNKWFVVPLYRVNFLPLLFVGKIFVLVYHVGRKSGLQRYTPLEYRIKDGSLFLFSSRGKYSDWLRNIKANPDSVMIKMGFRKFKPEIEILQTTAQKEEIMRWYAQSFPKATKALFGWDKKYDTLDNTDLTPIAEFIEIVKISNF